MKMMIFVTLVLVFVPVIKGADHHQPDSHTAQYFRDKFIPLYLWTENNQKSSMYVHVHQILVRFYDPRPEENMFFSVRPQQSCVMHCS